MLLVHFCMTTTLEAIEQFPQMLDKYSNRTSDREVSRVATDIGRVKDLNPPVYNSRGIEEFLRGRATHLKQLVDEYFVKSMSHEFPLIDDGLFELKRQITLVRKGKEYIAVNDVVGEEKDKPEETKENKIVRRVVTVPLFAYTPLFEGEHKTKLGIFSRTKNRIKAVIDSDGDINNYRYTSRQKISIEAKLSGSIGPNLKEAYRHAMQHYFSTLANMFTDTAAADIMYSEGGEFTRPVIGAIWIPTPESLNVTVTEKLIRKRKDLDPAMIITARGKKYLVQTWRVDDEEPFEHYIREFTTGDLKGKLRTGK